MDPRPPAFSGRRRSSVLSSDPAAPPPAVAPRRASTWDDDAPASGGPTASDISSRRASANDGAAAASQTPEYSAAGSIAGRKASAWDGGPPVGGSGGGSASDIAGRRATAMDRPPWDGFAGSPPSYEGSTWGWMSEIAAMSSAPVGSLLADRIKVFYDGNINYIFDNHNGQRMEVDDLKAVMFAYGVDDDDSDVQRVVDIVDPQGSGVLDINSENKEILLSKSFDFMYPKDPLYNLRQASKCYQKHLLAPLHFAGYIFHFLDGLNYHIGNEHRFMVLGVYSILGVLEGSSNRRFTAKDVKTFMSLWRLTNPDEAKDLLSLIEDDYGGTISPFQLYNLLYRRNLLGKQRIQMLDTTGPDQDPSLFFPLIDKDEDGFLSSSDLRDFAAIFGRAPAEEGIRRVSGMLDVNGDGVINRDDFREAMLPILDGLTWEFWLVAILFELKM